VGEEEKMLHVWTGEMHTVDGDTTLVGLDARKLGHQFLR